MVSTAAPGFFGKLYTKGDFIDRRLPVEFIRLWDGWLQEAIFSSQKQLGENWQPTYMNSPVWRFGLSSGTCGRTAWAGVLMPSIDNVGRQFPLTLAAPIPNNEELPHLFASQQGLEWFTGLEQLALSCLHDDFDLDIFDNKLKTSCPPHFTLSPLNLPNNSHNSITNKLPLIVNIPSLEKVSAILPDVNAALLQHFLPTYSLWSCESERVGGTFLLMEGLPPKNTYADLLTGCRRQFGIHTTPLGLRTLQTAPTSVPTSFSPAPAASKTSAEQESELSLTRPLMTPKVFYWRSWGLCVTGKQRSNNEDRLLEKTSEGLWAVADGMGGHDSGEIASEAVVTALAKLVACKDVNTFAKQVEQALNDVNTQLIQLAATNKAASRVIGSTVVVFLAMETHCIYLWAGDSRLYRFRDNRLEQLTHDHSLFAEFARQGLLTAEQLTESGRCDTITRGVGANDILVLEQGECEAQPGDVFLLCSDGVDKELSHAEIETIFRQTPVADIVSVLINTVEERGARDNVTAIVTELLKTKP